MRSGNGRHRRPRQAPALIVAAGVTGSAIALPLLGAASAHAADASTWDRVADCESGGVWSANLHNGYYGGLQITQEAWDAFGGDSYAVRPDLASRSQQITVAERILAAQGPKAWTSCGAGAGLSLGSPAPSVDPGTGPTSPSELQSADAGDESALHGFSDDGLSDGGAAEGGASHGGTVQAGSGSGVQENPVTPSSSGSADVLSSGSPSSTGSPSSGSTASGSASGDPGVGSTADGSGVATSGTGAPTGAVDASGQPVGKHRGGTASESALPGLSGEDRDSGRHASRDDATGRDAAVTAPADDQYTVRPGDCLWDIANQQKVSGGWHALYEANQETVGADPDLILPGQSLDLSVK
jgi:resuscitation-promoting factor RpfA